MREGELNKKISWSNNDHKESNRHTQTYAYSKLWVFLEKNLKTMTQIRNNWILYDTLVENYKCVLEGWLFLGWEVYVIVISHEWRKYNFWNTQKKNFWLLLVGVFDGVTRKFCSLIIILYYRLKRCFKKYIFQGSYEWLVWENYHNKLTYGQVQWKKWMVLNIINFRCQVW